MTPSPILSPAQAIERLLSNALSLTDPVSVPLAAALHRVLAEDAQSRCDVPPQDVSMMDGYAWRIDDGQTGLRAVTLRLAAGSPRVELPAGTAARIFTGAAVPEGADAVVMQEQCRLDDAGWVISGSPVRPRQNIRPRAEDLRDGQVVLSAGTRMRSADLALLASAGVDRVWVTRSLKVTTVFTGDELVPPGRPLAPGQIYDSNRTMIQALLTDLGCEIVDLGNVPDQFEATVAVLERAAREADLILTCGGVSVGEEDHVRTAVAQLGAIDLWQVSIKPGKPFAFGRVGKTPFLGLPGNPVSAYVVFLLFVQPFIRRCQGEVFDSVTPLRVRAGFAWARASDRVEWLRARLRPTAEASEAVLHPNQGSASLVSLSWAEGLVEIPPGRPIESGDWVRFLPLGGDPQ